MKKYFFMAGFMAVATLLVSCGSASETSKKKSTETPTGAPEITGKDNYKKNCMSCHGSDGDMGISGAKKFSESVMEENDRVMIITNGKGSMPSFGNKLSEQEIKDLAAYTMTLGK